MDEWKPLDGYPGYSINRRGQVRNDELDRIMKVSLNTYGLPFIAMTVDRLQVRRGLARLVAQTFVPKNPMLPYFDTPIQLDGDQTNCNADNILWRPRWFAMRYTRQFKIEQQPHLPVRNLLTGQIENTAWPFVTATGLLYRELIIKAYREEAMFPTRERFRFERG